ncbi:MAG: hypothetical protein U9N87_09630 [Planctomycetota bacterium]|nr:hypothetical protein [Planctomycetota bacterium]
MHALKSFFISFVFLAATPVLFCGCGGDGRLPVSGNITLDGKPLELGAITFVPSGDKKANSSGTTVTEGKYSLPSGKGLMAGKYRVSITPIHKTGKQIKNSMTGKMEAEQFPVKYKEAGKLEATIEAGKKNKLDFAITQLK